MSQTYFYNFATSVWFPVRAGPTICLALNVVLNKAAGRVWGVAKNREFFKKKEFRILSDLLLFQVSEKW